jgi:hypothetical protein
MACHNLDKCALMVLLSTILSFNVSKEGELLNLKKVQTKSICWFLPLHNKFRCLMAWHNLWGVSSRILFLLWIRLLSWCENMNHLFGQMNVNNHGRPFSNVMWRLPWLFAQIGKWSFMCTLMLFISYWHYIGLEYIIDKYDQVLIYVSHVPNQEVFSTVFT